MFIKGETFAFNQEKKTKIPELVKLSRDESESS